MTISTKSQAILLLTAHFSKPQQGDPKPLGPVEWGRFAAWLNSRVLSPEDLLKGQLSDTLEGWADSKISVERIDKLLDRGTALALAMEKWSRSGLWVVTRADGDQYPKILKQRLQAAAPPVWFGCGEKVLLGRGGLAVVGSRNASADDLEYAKHLGALAAAAGYSVVSGGARGIDETAMLGALEAGGTAIGVMADSLLRSCSSAKYRRSLKEGNLVLVSPFYPDAGFNTGNAMARNKYIYCLANAGVAVHSATSGGTWSGATENLKKTWVPLWLKRTSDVDAGNEKLVEMGGNWLPDSLTEGDVERLIQGPGIESAQEVVDVVNEPQVRAAETAKSNADSETITQVGAAKEPVGVTVEKPEGAASSPAAPEVLIDEPAQRDGLVAPIEREPTFYGLFLTNIERLCHDQPRAIDELVDELGLKKVQVNEWLKLAVQEGHLKKLSRPVRYQWLDAQGVQEEPQIGLFGAEEL